jgi:malonate decarboxylase beta subunit
VTGRGRCWLEGLADRVLDDTSASVLAADGQVGDEQGRFIAVVPDPENPFERARGGEVGIRESLALADVVRAVIAEDETAEQRRPIVAVVDLPSHAYGRLEEQLGLYLTLAAAVDAYQNARVAGHPVIALVVGTALSGGFLAHGLQANQILALDDPDVEIHAMHKPAAAKITQRTVEQLEALGAQIAPLSYSVRDWATLGFCDQLLTVGDPDRPSAEDHEVVRQALIGAVARARRSPILDRLRSAQAQSTRQASIKTRDAIRAQWHD